MLDDGDLMSLVDRCANQRHKDNKKKSKELELIVFLELS